MNSVNELMWKLDLTKLYVVSGDVPAGDWIFNGESMVLAKNPHSDKQVAGDDERIDGAQSRGQLPSGKQGYQQADPPGQDSGAGPLPAPQIRLPLEGKGRFRH